MSTDSIPQPVSAKRKPDVENAIDVGEDLEFQRRWWRFERVVWTVFVLILIADCLGAFGEGWLAHSRLRVPGSGLDVQYERIVRASTPTKLTIHFNQAELAPAHAVQLFVSNSLVDDLGNQRIAPQPAVSAIGQSGIMYVFPWTGAESSVLFSMQPSKPGVAHFTLRVPGHPSVSARVIILP